MLDINSNEPYPSCDLSNLAAHEFVLDGIKCASMEGLLQSFKEKNPETQKKICALAGSKAKFRGKNIEWWKDQILYWKGKTIGRKSQEYQDLLDIAYEALAENEGFKRALLATDNAILGHSIGSRKASRTILTVGEFIRRLMKIRERLQKEAKTP